MITMLEYRGYKITTNGNPYAPEVKVWLQGTFGLPLHETTSLDQAMHWIDRDCGDPDDDWRGQGRDRP